MNKRTRLIVSLLFVVLIILAVAITRFYLNVPKSPAVNGGSDTVEKIVVSNDEEYSIFTDSAGNCGIVQSGRITAVPEWQSLEFAGDYLCIASKRIGGSMKYGCIDFDGNAVVPFVYSKIEKEIMGGSVFYCAESDGSFVVYDSDFTPCFNTAWQSCEFTEDELHLHDNNGSYTYVMSKDGLLFKSANYSGSIMNRPYELNIYSRVLLSKLSPVMIEQMMKFTEIYIEYAFRKDDDEISKAGVDMRNFSMIFPDSDEIMSRRLIAIPEVHVYNVGTENGEALHEVSVSADAELLYTAENGETEKCTNTLKASVRFRGSYETNLEAVSGSFEPQIPDYPQEETTNIIQ